MSPTATGPSLLVGTSGKQVNDRRINSRQRAWLESTRDAFVYPAAYNMHQHHRPEATLPASLVLSELPPRTSKTEGMQIAGEHQKPAPHHLSESTRQRLMLCTRYLGLYDEIGRRESGQMTTAIREHQNHRNQASSKVNPGCQSLECTIASFQGRGNSRDDKRTKTGYQR
jgi:hypothetical protein